MIDHVKDGNVHRFFERPRPLLVWSECKYTVLSVLLFYIITSFLPSGKKPLWVLIVFLILYTLGAVYWMYKTCVNSSKYFRDQQAVLVAAIKSIPETDECFLEFTSSRPNIEMGYPAVVVLERPGGFCSFYRYKVTKIKNESTQGGIQEGDQGGVSLPLEV